MISGILILLLLTVLLPLLVGGLFDRIDRGPVFRFASGFMLLWAGFLAISVPLILRAGSNSFKKVMLFYGIFMGAVAAVSLIKSFLEHRKRSTAKKCASERPAPETAKEAEGGFTKDKVTAAIWLISLSLLVLQIVVNIFFAYEEGDDSFYVATATITEYSGTMYEILPYKGGSTGLDARHGLAPFPVWIAMLAKLSGFHSATVSQIFAPTVLMLLAYGIYYLFSVQLFKKDRRKQALFFLITELLVLFGGYSLYTAENFLLVRTAQGKAVLANSVLPFMLFLFLLFLESLQENRKLSIAFWPLMLFTCMTGCLCSTQGALLCCILLGLGGACAAVSYRKWKFLLPLGACCVVPVAMALLYLVLG